MGMLHMFAWVCYICLHGYATCVCMGMLHMFAWVCYICLHGYVHMFARVCYLCLHGCATFVCMGMLHMFAWVCYICLHIPRWLSTPDTLYRTVGFSVWHWDTFLVPCNKSTATKCCKQKVQLYKWYIHSQVLKQRLVGCS